MGVITYALLAWPGTISDNEDLADDCPRSKFGHELIAEKNGERLCRLANAPVSETAKSFVRNFAQVLEMQGDMPAQEALKHPWVAAVDGAKKQKADGLYPARLIFFK